MTAPSIEDMENNNFPAPVLLDDGSIVKFGDETLQSYIRLDILLAAYVLLEKNWFLQATRCLRKESAERIFPEAQLRICVFLCKNSCVYLITF